MTMFDGEMKKWRESAINCIKFSGPLSAHCVDKGKVLLNAWNSKIRITQFYTAAFSYITTKSTQGEVPRMGSDFS